MRKLILPLLLASALVPAAAYAQESDSLADRIRERAERSDRAQRSDDRGVRSERSERPARTERAQRAQRAGPPEPVEPQLQVQRVERQADGVRTQRNRSGRRPTLADGFRAAARDEEQRQQVQASDDRRDQTRDGRRDGRRDQSLDGRRDGQRDGTRWADHVRGNDQRWTGDRGRRDRWSSDWRRDRRYDWRGHRDRYGSRYRLGRYYDPFGWGYRRFTIGFSLRPSYYSANYWLSDPWAYRLPPAYGPYRWVRYYDDALLVNIYSGQVVDVIHSFFW